MTDAEITARERVYKGYSTITKLTLRLPDGAVITREVEDHGHPVAVLPYDPIRRLAMLVRVIRAPVLESKGLPSILEPPAGMIDGGEDAETAARREAMEEVGLKLRVMEKVATIFTTPGVSTETMALFLAEYSEADRVADGGGLIEENEGLTVVETPLAELRDLGIDGRPVDGKLLSLVQALKLKRPELF